MADIKDLRMRGTTAVDISDDAGTIHPFLVSNKSLFHVMHREMLCVIADPQAKKILGLAGLNVLCAVLLLFWCSSTNSMALTAYTYLTIFDIFGLLTSLVSIWVQHKKPDPIFSFGYGRFEVVAVFASTILAQFGSLFIIKGSIERMLVQPEIHTGRLLIGTSLAFCFHILVTYTMDNRAFNHVITASSSSWLQEHVSDISESICNVVPGISKLLLPRINPFALIAFAGGTALVFVYLLIDIRSFYSADTWAALWIAMMTVGTMLPMSVYSGKILLQTTPSHIIGQLDKSIREASTLDGVLEFRHEHFWTLTFGTMAGSVHVRVRRDADEQMVLAHVYHRLSNIVMVLTVQIFKDDWSRPSSIHILNNLSGAFGATSPTGPPGPPRVPSPVGSLYSNSSPNSSQYNSIPRSQAPVLLPSRTDPAVAALGGGTGSGNIPALRLAANSSANNPQVNPLWNKPSLPVDSNRHIDRTNSCDKNTAHSQVISLGNLGNSYLGSGLNMGGPNMSRQSPPSVSMNNIFPGPGSEPSGTQQASQPYRIDLNTQQQKDPFVKNK